MAKKSKKEMELEAIRKLKKIVEQNTESAQFDADNVLCKLLIDAGFRSVVMIYENVEKDYWKNSK